MVYVLLIPKDFISVITPITLPVSITHNRESAAERVFSLKGEENLRKIPSSFTAMKKLPEFQNANYMFRHIMVTMTLICSSIGALLISKYGSGTKSEFFWLFS